MNAQKSEEEIQHQIQTESTSAVAAQTNSIHKITQPRSSSVTVFLQGLTYIFWHWSIIIMSVIFGGTIGYFMNSSNSNDYNFIAYFAGVLFVVLPLAFIFDRLYSKNESAEKHGFAGVMYVLFAILAVIGIASGLITSLVVFINFLIDAGAKGKDVLLTVAIGLFVAVTHALLLARITGFKKAGKPKTFRITLTVMAAVLLILWGAGPLVKGITLRSDRLIEDNLYTLSSAINEYARTNKELPESLDDLSFSNYQQGAEQLVESGLVTYAPLEADLGTDLNSDISSIYNLGSTRYSNAGSISTQAYELCVTYKASKGSGKDNKTLDYTFSRDHSAGEVCYEDSVNI